MKIKKNVEDWQILMALVNDASPCGLGWFEPGAHTSISEDEAKKFCVKTRYVDYCCGRPIKTNIHNRPLDLYLYDRDAGEGSGERALRAAGLLEE